MDKVLYSEILASTHESTRRQNPEERRYHCGERLKNLTGPADLSRPEGAVRFSAQRNSDTIPALTFSFENSIGPGKETLPLLPSFETSTLVWLIKRGLGRGPQRLKTCGHIHPLLQARGQFAQK
jgi:hypothetical protein